METDKEDPWSFLKRTKDGCKTFPKPVVPTHLGIFCLSRQEVKKDLREIERNLQDDDETDSDSSVKSEDILASSYPVKPRKTAKLRIVPEIRLNRGYIHGDAQGDRDRTSMVSNLRMGAYGGGADLGRAYGANMGYGGGMAMGYGNGMGYGLGMNAHATAAAAAARAYNAQGYGMNGDGGMMMQHQQEYYHAAMREREAAANAISEQEKAEYKAAEEAITFIKAIKKSDRHIFNAESERERLEALKLSFEEAVQATLKEYSQEKKEQENYFIVMQSLYVRALRLHCSYSRQNAMIYGILVALQRLREGSSFIESQTLRLRSLMEEAEGGGNGKANAGSSSSSSSSSSASNRKGSAKSQRKEETKDKTLETTTTTTNHQQQPPLSSSNASLKSGLAPGEIDLLRVHLQKANKEVVLFKSQWIITPMGEGQIISIQPQAMKVVIKLNFGVMFAHLARVVCWGNKGESLDATTESHLCDTWNSLCNIVSIPQKSQIAIRALVDPLIDDDGTTDVDGNDSSGEETMGANDDAPSSSSSSSSSSNASSSKSNTSSSNASGSAPRQGGTAAAAPTDAIDRNLLPSFPLKVTEVETSQQPRFIVRKRLQADACNEPLNLNTLPLAFVPPGALPYLVNHMQSNGEGIPEVFISKQALADVNNVNVSTPLAWSGDIGELKTTLQVLIDDINIAEKEQAQYISQIESIRSQCAQVSQDIAVIRLGMSNRRIRHRTNLTSHGVNLSAAAVGLPANNGPPTTAGGGESAASAAAAEANLSNISRHASMDSFEDPNDQGVSTSALDTLSAEVENSMMDDDDGEIDGATALTAMFNSSSSSSSNPSPSPSPTIESMQPQGNTGGPKKRPRRGESPPPPAATDGDAGGDSAPVEATSQAAKRRPKRR